MNCYRFFTPSNNMHILTPPKYMFYIFQKVFNASAAEAGYAFTVLEPE